MSTIQGQLMRKADAERQRRQRNPGSLCLHFQETWLKSNFQARSKSDSLTSSPPSIKHSEFLSMTHLCALSINQF